MAFILNSDGYKLYEALSVRFNSNERRNFSLSISGAFTHLRKQEKFNLLGDYIILSTIVDFYKNKNIPFKRAQLVYAVGKSDSVKARFISSYAMTNALLAEN